MHMCVKVKNNVWGQFHLYVTLGDWTQLIRFVQQEPYPLSASLAPAKETELVFGKVGTILGIFQFSTVVFYYGMWC